MGAKDRETDQVSTAAVASTDAPTLQGFVEARTEPTAQVYTDEAASYNGLNRSHETVKHSARKYVHGMAHTNGMESHWAMLKRGYVGVYHQMSAKHLHRYASEFEGRHNSRSNDTINQVRSVIRGMDGKRLRYQDLIGWGGIMLNRSIIRETVRDMFRKAFIETIYTFDPPIAQKSDGNLVRSAVPDLVNEQTTQVVAAESEQAFVQESDIPTR